MAMVDETTIGIQSGTDRTLFLAWKWTKSNTDHYEVKWYYLANGIWFLGNEEDTKQKNSVYTPPENAVEVKGRVRAVSKKKSSGSKYWTCEWDEMYWDFGTQAKPPAASVPSVKIEKYTLTATVENIDVGVYDYTDEFAVKFEVVVDNENLYRSEIIRSKIDMNHASFSCVVNSGSEYKVRCRIGFPHSKTYTNSYRWGEWSNYSSNASTIPNTPPAIKTIRSTTSTSIYLEWDATKTAESYDVEYSTKREYLGSSDQTTVKNGIEETHYELTGLETGSEYFFRIRAVNKNGESGWSGVKSIIIGKKPAAPTTWSSTTTVLVGEPLVLYWAHNAADGSRQAYAEIELHINGTSNTIRLDDTSNDDSEDEKDVMQYAINTSTYTEGTEIQWRVRTAGVLKNESGEPAFSDWSIQRTVDIYAPPTLSMRVADNNGTNVETLTVFPIHVTAAAGPVTQTPMSYHLAVIANETYETSDDIGNFKMVLAGQTIYSKHFDISSPLDVVLSAGDVSLENTYNYTIKCTVSMDSGLTAEASHSFNVGWDKFEYEPDAEIGVDLDTYAVTIGPYCLNSSGARAKDVTLAVYRREYDGGFTEIASGLDNTINVYVTDPHPALDYARYRIVATSNLTGAVSYYDIPAEPINGTAVIIQWDEAWSDYIGDYEDLFEQPAYAGSMLKLPYNIDISDSYKPDVALVEYIGREHPVSYYGTQRGVSSTWSVEIDKKDVETIYALRRLARWMGDVYVREPSGSGYWANVVVSFDITHRELTVPVTLDVTRVEGGM